MLMIFGSGATTYFLANLLSLNSLNVTVLMLPCIYYCRQQFYKLSEVVYVLCSIL